MVSLVIDELRIRLIYIHLLPLRYEEYAVRCASSVSEANKLIELGFIP
jgi:hypothetical protein